MAILTSKEFYKRHQNEFNKYLFKEKRNLIICNKSSSLNFEEQKNTYIEEIDIIENTLLQVEKIEDVYDLIILSDVLEVSGNMAAILKSLDKNLAIDGKILVTSINPIWNTPLRLLEFLNLKEKSERRSYIHLKKIGTVFESIGYSIVSSNSRQYIPFKLFYLGNFINKILELTLFFLNFGIRTYIVLRKNINETGKIGYKKSIIVPAKNEEKNLEILISRIPRFGTDTEVIISCGKSTDDTLKVAKSLKSDDFSIKVIEQSLNGKANAVWEAIEVSTGDVIAILDADISVDPERLEDFFEIIDNNKADFVNGSRLIYSMEKGSMRFINNIGNRIFQFVISVILRLPLTDSLCGTKVFKRSLYEKILYWQETVDATDPFCDFDLLFSAAFAGEKIVEFPIHYRTRIYGKTQINRFRDGYKLIKYLLKSFYKFNCSTP